MLVRSILQSGVKLGLKPVYQLLYFRLATEFYDALEVQALGFQHMAEVMQHAG